jgi:hypothetical protein
MTTSDETSLVNGTTETSIAPSTESISPATNTTSALVESSTNEQLISEGEGEPADYTALIAVGAIAAICLIVCIPLLLTRKRIRSSERFSKIYYAVPCGAYIFCFCRPRAKRRKYIDLL